MKPTKPKMEKEKKKKVGYGGMDEEKQVKS